MLCEGVPIPSATMAQPFVDAAFRVHGEQIPLDHGYHLYAALSRWVPAVHDHPSWEHSPGYGHAERPESARAHPRLAFAHSPAGGRDRHNPAAGRDYPRYPRQSVMVGVPEMGLLTPRGSLRARLVQIKGYVTPEEFAGAVRRQLEQLAGPDAAAATAINVGARRVFRVQGYVIVGFALTLDKLEPEASLAVQKRGIGGRRLMGCGVFIPSGQKRNVA